MCNLEGCKVEGNSRLKKKKKKLYFKPLVWISLKVLINYKYWLESK